MSTITIEQKTWVDIKIYKDKFITQLQQKGRGGEQLIAIENDKIAALIKAIGGESELDRFAVWMKEHHMFLETFINRFRQSEKG